MASTQDPRKLRQILLWLGSAEKRLVTRANRALKGAELPYAQFLILDHLASLPGQGWTVTELASALETGQPGVSKILNRLAAKNYVRVESGLDDRRLKRHFLTESGFSAHGDASRRLAPQAGAVFRDWQAGDIDTLHKLLYRLKSDLRA